MARRARSFREANGEEAHAIGPGIHVYGKRLGAEDDFVWIKRSAAVRSGVVTTPEQMQPDSAQAGVLAARHVHKAATTATACPSGALARYEVRADLAYASNLFGQYAMRRYKDDPVVLARECCMTALGYESAALDVYPDKMNAEMRNHLRKPGA